MPPGRPVDLDTTSPQLGGSSIQIGNLELDMKGTAAVSEKSQATLAQAQERELAGHVE
jgi:hypothetical protein